ncbi:MAG: deoxyribose-phosphate aldolase [Oligoflexia bacterium]|nr:deoxyribose-phosphate aldolase [Oligoflexia bacterium]
MSNEKATTTRTYGLCTLKFKGAENEKAKEQERAVASEAYDQELASLIDHTLLKPEASKEELQQVCAEARQYRFATVCVNSSNIPLVATLLLGSSVKPIAVVGFPLGAATAKAKAYESREAIAAGAREIDMVINIGAMKSKEYRTVYEDICAVVLASAPYPVKVILETSGLTHDEKVAACVLSKTAGAAFVKTSTGFAKGGATVEDIALMRSLVGPEMGVKASGGVRTREDADAMIKAGASRIGASSSVAIVTGKKGSSSY